MVGVSSCILLLSSVVLELISARSVLSLAPELGPRLKIYIFLGRVHNERKIKWINGSANRYLEYCLSSHSIGFDQFGFHFLPLEERLLKEDLKSSRRRDWRVNCVNFSINSSICLGTCGRGCIKRSKLLSFSKDPNIRFKWRVRSWETQQLQICVLALYELRRLSLSLHVLLSALKTCITLITASQVRYHYSYHEQEAIFTCELWRPIRWSL